MDEVWINLELTKETSPEVKELGTPELLLFEHGFGRRLLPPRLKQLLPTGMSLAEAKSALKANGFHWEDIEAGEGAGALFCKTYVSDAVWLKPETWIEGHRIDVEVWYEQGKVVRVLLFANAQRLHNHLFRPGLLD